MKKLRLAWHRAIPEAAIDELPAECPAEEPQCDESLASCSPRECVWLMLIARAQTRTDASALIVHLRLRLLQTECQADEPAPEWSWT